MVYAGERWRHVQRDSSRRSDDAQERTERRRSTGRDRQHGERRGVRRPAGTGRVRRQQGRHRIHDAARRPRPRGHRYPGQRRSAWYVVSVLILLMRDNISLTRHNLLTLRTLSNG